MIHTRLQVYELMPVFILYALVLCATIVKEHKIPEDEADQCRSDVCGQRHLSGG